MVLEPKLWFSWSSTVFAMYSTSLSLTECISSKIHGFENTSHEKTDANLPIINNFVVSKNAINIIYSMPIYYKP